MNALVDQTPMQPGLQFEPESAQMDNDTSRDYQRIATALAWLADNFARQPKLAEVAAQVHLSEFHFQRLFTRWAGLSPKRYVQLLTLERAKARLADSRSALDAALDAGFSAPSRLHDAMVSVDAMSPGEFRRQGAGLSVRYGFADTPFGEALIGTCTRGLCTLAFVDGERDATLDETRSRVMPRADYRRDDAHAADVAARVFEADAERPPLLLCGSEFQVQVWRALLRVPEGALVSYGGLAASAGKPGAARAIGGAVGANPIAWLVPCHRVLRESGALGGYHFGPARKLAMLSMELTRASA